MFSLKKRHLMGYTAVCLHCTALMGLFHSRNPGPYFISLHTDTASLDIHTNNLSPFPWHLLPPLPSPPPHTSFPWHRNKESLVLGNGQESHLKLCILWQLYSMGISSPWRNTILLESLGVWRNKGFSLYTTCTNWILKPRTADSAHILGNQTHPQQTNVTLFIKN